MNNNSLEQELTEIKIILARIEVDLKHHVRRTDELQAQKAILADTVQSLRIDISKFKAGLALSGWVAATLIALAHLLIKLL